jgi:alkylhydroperoxidase family enzyme
VRISVPEGAHPVMHVWGAMVPGIGPAASAFSAAVYERTTLGLREFEAARLRIAQVNGCLFCLDWRTERDGEVVEEGFLEAVEQWRTTDALDDRARMAAEYAERFALDHLSLDGDEAFWERFRALYTEAEMVELSMCLGSWLAFGRLNHVFGLDAACVLPTR